MREQHPLRTHNLQQQKLNKGERGYSKRWRKAEPDQPVPWHQDTGGQHSTWSRAWGGHVVNEILQRRSNGDEGMVHGGVLLVGHPVVVMVVGPGTASPQPPVIVANIEHHDQQEAEQTHWAGNHRCKGNRAKRRGYLCCGNCRTQRRQRHRVDWETRWIQSWNRHQHKSKVISV